MPCLNDGGREKNFNLILQLCFCSQWVSVELKNKTEQNSSESAMVKPKESLTGDSIS